MADEHDSGIKVSDRRMFNPDGSLRDTQVEREAEPVILDSPPLPVQAGAARQAPEVQPSFEPAEEPAVGEEPEMTDFMQFLYSFASSTSFIHLGLVEHPATGRAEVNLPAAQQGIAMLLLLREKTKGNLSRVEDEFMESLLGDLQMQFVSLKNQAPGPRR